MASASKVFGVGANRRRYYHYASPLTKGEAMRLAKQIRRRGYKARIAEETQGYTVFSFPHKREMSSRG